MRRRTALQARALRHRPQRRHLDRAGHERIGRPERAQRLQGLSDLLDRHRGAAAEQVAERALVQQMLVLRARPARQADAQPQQMARPGQRDIEQPQILAQALALGLVQRLAVGREVQPAPALGIDPLDERRIALLHRPRRRREGHHHHRIFQALGLVHRDDLHQLGIALQPHHPLVAAGLTATAAQARDLLGQPADLRLLALEPAAGRLQQLAQVQQVGQAPLAVGHLLAGQPARRQVQQMQRLAHQRQHALALPDAAQLRQQRQPRVPGHIVVHQPRQLVERQAHRRGGEGRTRQPGVLRLGHRLQPAQQVARLGGVEDGILVGQIDRGHAGPAQRPAHRLGLAAVAHQHRDVARRQAARLAAGAAKGQARVVEPVDDALGGAARQHLAQFLGRQRLRQPLDLQRRQRGVATAQRLVAPLGADRIERQRGLAAGTRLSRTTEAEGLAGPALLGLQEDRVDRTDQRLRRAVVGAQRVVAPGGGAAHRQVAVDVGAAEAVDRLLRVADHQQRGGRIVVGDAVEAVEQPVLQRRGVLELVDQRDRVLRQDALAQPRAGLARQRLLEPALQVGEAELRRGALELVEPLRDAPRRMAQQARARRLQRRQLGLQRLELGEGGRDLAAVVVLLQRLAQAVGRQPPRAGVGLQHQPLGQRILGPGDDLAMPFLQRLRIDLDAAERRLRSVLLAVDPGEHRLGPLDPAGLERQQPRAARLDPVRQPVGQRLRAVGGVQQLLVHQQRPGLAAHRLGIGPLAVQQLQRGHRQRIDLAAPDIEHRLLQQLGLVGDQLLGEQAAAVEGMLAQRALAPGVDGVHRRLVHALGRQRQPMRGARAGRLVGAVGGQRLHEGVAAGRQRRGVAEQARRIDQPLADARGQLARRRAGEGHHQDLRRQQRPRLARAVVAVAEHQAQVERRDGPGLAGAGAGLDQARAAQRQGQRIEPRAHAASSAPAAPASSSSSPASASPSGSTVTPPSRTQACSGP